MPKNLDYDPYPAFFPRHWSGPRDVEIGKILSSRSWQTSRFVGNKKTAKITAINT